MRNDNPQDLIEVEIDNKPLSVDLVINWQLPVLVILFVSVIFVSIKTVVHRHESRVSFMQLQKLEKERDLLAAQWSRLKLEQGVALNQVRVERHARWNLNMSMPKASKIRMVREYVKPLAVQSISDSSISTKLNTSEVALGD